VMSPDEGELMRLKIVGRIPPCIAAESEDQTATYDYRPGAFSGSALGYGRAVPRWNTIQVVSR